MKKTTAALLAVICALFTGCSLDSGSDRKPISVPYSAMINPKSAPSDQDETVTEQANAQKQAAAAAEPATDASSAQQSSAAQSGVTPAPTPTPAPSSTSSNESKPASPQEKPASSQAPAKTETSNTESEPKLVLVTPTKTPDKTTAGAVNKDIASTPLGGICYLPYKPDEPVETSEPDKTTSGESGSESNSEPKKKKEKTKYDYGYRVVFRTSSETYLMGVTPYKSCKWDDIGKICKEIEDKLETECEMLGAPSLEDLKMFTEAGIYFPERHEIWTSTLTAEKGFKAYYRNTKGTFYSTRSTSDICGVCVIIKVKTSQSNSELLSNSQPNFNELKSRLEKEAEAYKKSQSAS